MNNRQVNIRVNMIDAVECKEALSNRKFAGYNTPSIMDIIESCAQKKLRELPDGYRQAYRKRTDDLYYIASRCSPQTLKRVKMKMLEIDGDTYSFFSEAFEEHWRKFVNSTSLQETQS